MEYKKKFFLRKKTPLRYRIRFTENGHLDMNEFMNLMTIKTAAVGEVNDMFKTFDVDKNGFIDWNELKMGMQNLVGHELEDSDIDEMMEEADLDGDGRINYAGID